MFGFLSKVASAVKNAASKTISAIANVGSKVIKKVAAGFVGVKNVTKKVGGWVVSQVKEKVKMIKRIRFSIPLLVDVETEIDTTIQQALPSSSFEERQALADELEQQREMIRFERFRQAVEALNFKVEELLAKNEVQDFDNYLRIQVSLRFLKDLMMKLSGVETLTNLGEIDVRFVGYIENLLKMKQMTDEEIHDFDEIVIKEYGKNLVALGGEQIFALWAQEQGAKEAEWKDLSEKMINYRQKIEVLNTKLEVEQQLSAEERDELAILRSTIAHLGSERGRLETRLTDLREIVGATEGLLLVIENEEKDSVMRDFARKVERIIMDWQKGIEPTDEQRQEVQLFARVYLAKARVRSRRVLSELEMNIGV